MDNTCNAVHNNDMAAERHTVWSCSIESMTSKCAAAVAPLDVQGGNSLTQLVTIVVHSSNKPALRWHPIAKLTESLMLELRTVLEKCAGVGVNALTSVTFSSLCKRCVLALR